MRGNILKFIDLTWSTGFLEVGPTALPGAIGPRGRVTQFTKLNHHLGLNSAT